MCTMKIAPIDASRCATHRAMQLRSFGNTPLRVSPLGFGGAEIGFEHADEATVTRMLNEALDLGLNVVDTAAAYLASEELIGRAIKHRRDDYLLFSKCGALDGFSRSDWSRDGVLRTIESSLRALGTDHLDLAQLHSCDVATLRRGDAIEGLRTAQARGLTRYIGYSGDADAARVALELGVFDALQTSVNVADQEPLTLTLPLARERNVAVIAKRPVANAAWRHATPPPNSYHHPYWERLRALAHSCLEGDLDEAVGKALRFTVYQPGVCTAIVGTTKPGRFATNLAHVAKGPLPEAERAAIEARWRAVATADWRGKV
jgi:aryl-alcohol dehydrogenase-like predicted oxidoreductase